MTDDDKLAILRRVNAHLGRAITAAVALDPEDPQARRVVESISIAFETALSVESEIEEGE